MNRRNETRFEVSAPVSLTLLDHPDREMNCELVDVSGTGMQLVSDEAVPVDEMVCLEFGAHVVLAGVRYCSPRGEKFTIGVERLHVVFAITLAEHKTKAAQILALIESYQLRATQTANEAALAAQAQAQAQPPPEPVAEIPQPLVVSPEAPSDELREVALETTQVGRFSRTRVLSVAVGTVLVALTLAFLMFASPVKPKAVGSLVPASKEAPPPPAQATSVEVAKSEPAPPVPVVPVSISQVAAKTPAAPVAEASSLSRKRHLSLKLSGASWISACIDGKKLLERALAAGDSREIDFSGKAELRVGSAGDVALTLDGKSLGPLGQPGQLRLLEISSAGLRQLPMRAPADDCVTAPAN